MKKYVENEALQWQIVKREESKVTTNERLKSLPQRL